VVNEDSFVGLRQLNFGIYRVSTRFDTILVKTASHLGPLIEVVSRDQLSLRQAFRADGSYHVSAAINSLKSVI
jgi:hypothetical protein